MDNRGRRQKRQVTAPATRADRQPDGGRRQKAVLAVLEDRKSAGGQSAGVDVLRVRGSVQSAFFSFVFFCHCSRCF